MLRNQRPPLVRVVRRRIKLSWVSPHATPSPWGVPIQATTYLLVESSVKTSPASKKRRPRGREAYAALPRSVPDTLPSP
jgi:hypothetical protein